MVDDAEVPWHEIELRHPITTRDLQNDVSRKVCVFWHRGGAD